MCILPRSVIIFLLLSSTSLSSSASSLPRDWRKALVSIEVVVPPQSRGPGGSGYQAVGTGFFVTADTSPPFRAVMFTAAHVFEGVCEAGTSEVYLRIEESPSVPDVQVQRYALTICDRIVVGNNLTFRPRWIRHPRADLAAIIPQSAPGVHFPDVRPFPASFIAKAEDWTKWKVGEGEDVLAIMFYPNATPDRPSSPIVRQGVIAEAEEQTDTLLLSLTVFPGNSGAPVILRPTGIHFSLEAGTEIGLVNPPLLLGVVIEYVPYYEPAISPQTRRVRVMFEENSGLTRIVRSERISELLRQIASGFPSRN
jgi:hypothetical protein